MSSLSLSAYQQFCGCILDRFLLEFLDPGIRKSGKLNFQKFNGNFDLFPIPILFLLLEVYFDGGGV